MLHGLLLAAGGSARFGGIKQLALFRGESLLSRAASAAREALGRRVTVVLGAHADRLRAELEGLDVTSVVNADWRQGLGSSLRAGIAALPADCDAALVMLCDQPLITAESLKSLERAWRRDPLRLAACEYDDALGVPAVIPRQFFAQLANADGDRGARELIARHRKDVIRVPAPEAATDIDTAAALAEIGRT